MCNNKMEIVQKYCRCACVWQTERGSERKRERVRESERADWVYMASCKNNSPAKCSTVGRGFNYLDIMLHNVVISTSSRDGTGLSADSLLSA